MSPVSEHETASVAKEVVDVEVIDWQRWKASQITAQLITNAKSMACSSIWVINQQTSSCPVALSEERGSKAYAKTTHASEIGAFTVPVNFKNMVSLAAVAVLVDVSCLFCIVQS